jgi:hypothetical protein
MLGHLTGEYAALGAQPVGRQLVPAKPNRMR